ncbi:hypothetical protein WR25_13603 isoform B [Diploscapter pachys]|uniref:SPRY domain-containing protein 7 n=1 Tax=Diploscapter pachys TaxID=2018661 RepID=A0A2A2KNJ5_9BILA|nr:hypothetical protein WR25_13603 isoform B [Diploscapter pachys]
MSIFTSCCPFLSGCLDCLQGPSFAGGVSYSTLQQPITPLIRLDVSHMGKDVVILKEGERICGTGGAFSTVPIVQNKAYFQVDIQQTGVWGIGLGNRQAQIDSAPIEKYFWGLRESGQVFADGQCIGQLNKAVDEGDSIGIAYDHIEMKIYVNGEEAEPKITGVKGPVYPLLYVDDSAILDIKFKNFSYTPPSGFDEILVEQTLL